MLLVSKVIEEGMTAYRTEQGFHLNPYPPVPERDLHGIVTYSKQISMFRWVITTMRVRLEIDYSTMWEIGWNLAEMLDTKATVA